MQCTRILHQLLKSILDGVEYSLFFPCSLWGCSVIWKSQWQSNRFQKCSEHWTKSFNELSCHSEVRLWLLTLFSLSQILKLCPKKKSSAAYTFCKAMGLLGMQFHLFENECKSPEGEYTEGFFKPTLSHFHWHKQVLRTLFLRTVSLSSSDYPHGITILSPFGSDKKQVLNFCAQSAEELLKFLDDLKESIAEVSEMEQIRIECENTVMLLSHDRAHPLGPMSV